MPLIAGVDSSTQSTKIELRDQDSGEIVAVGSSPHPAVAPPTSEQHPDVWWTAFRAAWQQADDQARRRTSGPAGRAAVAALGIAAQQHGMVAVDADGVPVHPAKLWNDTESAVDADALVDRWGAAAWADAVGSVPVAAFTITKLAWLRRVHPESFDRIERVMLPHDHLTHRLTGQFTTDRGDASGTGYWSPATGAYRWDALALVDAGRDWSNAVPRVLGPYDIAGRWEHDGESIPIAPGTGDNMAGALGVGLRPGDVAISVGTSGTVFGVSESPTADPTGAVAGFADATGRFLPLVCTSNAAKVLDAIARLLDVDHDRFDRLALAAEPGGPTLLPYFDGERTPNRPHATGVLAGLRTDVSREQLARAAVDGVVCGLLDALDALCVHATVTGRVMLTGGAGRSAAVRAVLAGLLDRPLFVGGADEAVATGAAVQAAAVLEQVDHSVIQDRWGITGGTRFEAGVDGDDVRERYALLRESIGSG